MSKDRPLINPVVGENFYREELIRDKELQISRDQMKFQMDSKKTRLKQIFNGIQLKLKQRSDYIEHSPIWNTSAFSFAIVTFIFNILLLLVGGIIVFDDIQKRIPLFYDSVEETRVSADKSLIFVIPIFMIAFFILQIRFVMEIFVKDKRLAIAILWVMTLLNILFLISIIQIYRLIS